MYYSRDFSLSGDYRKIIVKPNDLLYEIVLYSDEKIALTKSDLDVVDLENKKEEKTSNILLANFY